MPEQTYIEWYAVQPTDRKPVKPLKHVRLVSQSFATQIHEWQDADDWIWHIGPGYKERIKRVVQPHPTGD